MGPHDHAAVSYSNFVQYEILANILTWVSHEERELQIARSEELDSAPQEQAMEDQANGEETTEEVAVDKHLDIGVLPIRGGRPT